MLPHEDTSLPQIVRNALARDYYEPKADTQYQDAQKKNRLRLEINLANMIEKHCPFWGGAIPFDGRRNRRCITSLIPPRTLKYSAQYNLELAQDMKAMYGDDAVAKEELVLAMAFEIIAELELLINGRDVKYFPCIAARPMQEIDVSTFEPKFVFDTIFYLAKPLDESFMRALKSPPVPITEPSVRFMNNYPMLSNDPVWPRDSFSRF